MEDSPPSATRGNDVDALLRSLQDRRGTFFAFFGAVLVTTLGGTLLTQPRYQAIAVIQLLPSAGREMDVAEVVTPVAGYYETRDRARTQMQVILSRAVREEVVRRYNALGGDVLDGTPDGLDELLRHLTVTPREDTQLVEIGVTDSDPERAARVANLIADVYCASNLEVRTDAARAARRWLDVRAETARAEYREADAAALAFQVAHPGVDLDAAEDAIAARRAALQAALGVATTERVTARGRLEEHQALLARGDAALLVGMFDDPALAALAAEDARQTTRVAETSSRYGEEHPEYQQAVGHARRLDALVADAVARNVEAEAARLRALARQEGELRAELARTKEERLEKERLAAEFAELALGKDRAWRLLGALADRAAEVELQAESRLNDVRMVDSALPPSRPVSPDLPLNLAVGAGVGLLGGLAATLARDRLDDTLRSREAALALGVPLLGELPHVAAPRADDRALHPHRHPSTEPAEALRAVRGALHHGAAPDGPRRLLVTSCLAGEGRTHVAVGLAVGYAQLGARVLLVDADRAHPGLHRLLGVADAAGLDEALDAPHAAARHVRPTAVRGLHLLSPGPRGGAPGAEDGRWEALLVALAEAWSVVIVDGPRATGNAETLAVARAVDGVVLVVRHGRVSRGAAAGAIGRLTRAGARVAGVVLNDVDADADDAPLLAARS